MKPETAIQVYSASKAAITIATKAPGLAGEGAVENQTGGRNNHSIDEYFRQEAEASKMYESIRALTYDVQAISKNTGIAESWIQRIKDHFFNNEHIKSNGNGKFDTDYEIAQAWTRFQQGTQNTKDIVLLNHELFESRFEGIFKTNYETADDAAVRLGPSVGNRLKGDYDWELLFYS